MTKAHSILVIKLGAMGDFVQAFPPFAAIRAHHPGARITLLTTKPYAAMARRSPWFDEVWEDGRPNWLDLPALGRLTLRMRRARFDRVYDLQTSSRSSKYRMLVGGRPEWSGIAKGASHPHANPNRNVIHTFERQRDQLEMAGIKQFPAPDLSWLEADISAFGLPERFALLIPGASPHRPGKRWPAAAFGELANGLDLPCVILGAKSEAPIAADIRAKAPQALDLTGRTGFLDIGAIARRATICVGNDTGPTHLVALCGCPTLALFGADSDPALCAPRGPKVEVLRHKPLSDLPVAQVRSALGRLRAP